MRKGRKLFPQLAGGEPFSLCDIYASTGCGLLTWQEIRGKEGKPETKRDAFLESDETGGRHGLLETVLEYMRKPRFNDAIVIQGGPGAAKSAFILHLTDQLLREGLCPLRIRLGDLDVQMPLLDALFGVNYFFGTSFIWVLLAALR